MPISDELLRGAVLVICNLNPLVIGGFTSQRARQYLDSKVHGANMGPIWGRQDPGGPHVGPMNLAIWVYGTLMFFGVHPNRRLNNSLDMLWLYCRCWVTNIQQCYSHKHYDVTRWKHFPRYCPFVRGIHRSPVNSHTKTSDAELWCFLWSAPE